ncbi:conserved Plasmodium protein, unknown function [Plasmodium reichenowi]|uniref:Uncharacterized protein n=1 Tax=Plasmodium reichenowi TaxID=5854 RepID=A0A2P9D2U6_PLARE|nr:conserved Plasmodium protein, unknown function [Plasmodium reichenowi]
MKGNESYDPLKEGCFPKINDSLNKYTMNTLNYHHSNNFSCEENKETYRENTLNINVTSDEDNELETYSSIILDKINHFKAQDEKIIYEESRREPNIYSNMSTILNFVKEQNKMNTLHIKNFIMENLKVTEEIKHDKDINNLMRRIEHEEIKELIASSGKRYFMEIRKIYLLMKKFNKEGYFPASNKDVLKKQSFKKNKNIKNLLQESIKKKNIQIQKLLKQYIILKGYYKNVCKKYKQENELLKSFFSFSNNQSYYLNLKYSPPHCRRNRIYFYPYTKLLRRKRLRRTSHFKEDRYVIYKEYFTNSIFRKYTHHKKRYKEIIQDILNDNKLLNLQFKKYKEKYKKNKKKTLHISSKKKKDKRNLDLSYKKKKKKIIYTHLFLPTRLREKINKSSNYNYLNKERENIINKEKENILYKDEEENILYKEEENILHKEEENILYKEEENILHKEEENILHKEEENILYKEEENILHKEEENILYKEEENILYKEEENILHKEEENILYKEEENILHKEEENILHKEEEKIINKNDEESITNREKENILYKEEENILPKVEENILHKVEENIIKTKNAEVKKKKNTLKKKKKKEKKNFLNDHMKKVTKNDDDDDNNMIKVEEKEKYNHEDGKENVSIDNVEECNKMKDEYDKKENKVSDIEEESVILDPKEQNMILDTNKEKLISKEKKKKKISRKIKKTKIEDNKDIKENENFNKIYDEKNIGEKEKCTIYEEKNKEHNVITEKDNVKMDNIDEQ